MEKPVILRLHTNRLKSFELKSFVNFSHGTGVILIFSSQISQECWIKVLCDMRSDHLIPRLLFRGNSIREGFLFSPENRLGENVRPNNFESSSNEILFHSLTGRNDKRRIDFVVKVNKIFIEEGNPCLETEMRDISVNSQTIIKMDFLNKSISIFFCLLSVGSKIEIEISHLTFISAISIENNLDVSLL